MKTSITKFLHVKKLTKRLVLKDLLLLRHKLILMIGMPKPMKLKLYISQS